MTVIRTFFGKETVIIFNQVYSAYLPREIQKTALRKLIMIDHAEKLSDLKAPPGNRLEALKGKRRGQYSIRINDQYRICFRYEDGDFYDVEITDYH